MLSNTNLRELTLASGENYKLHPCDTRAFVDVLKKAAFRLDERDRDTTANARVLDRRSAPQRGQR